MLLNKVKKLEINWREDPINSLRPFLKIRDKF